VKLRHPNILPPLEIEVADEAVPEHLESGWLPVASEEARDPEGDEPPGDTPTPRRVRRAGSDSQKETAE
jgi:hypothetical protein